MSSQAKKHFEIAQSRCEYMQQVKIAAWILHEYFICVSGNTKVCENFENSLVGIVPKLVARQYKKPELNDPLNRNTWPDIIETSTETSRETGSSLRSSGKFKTIEKYPEIGRSHLLFTIKAGKRLLDWGKGNEIRCMNVWNGKKWMPNFNCRNLWAFQVPTFWRCLVVVFCPMVQGN
jgi:hypothetical protein